MAPPMKKTFSSVEQRVSASSMECAVSQFLKTSSSGLSTMFLLFGRAPLGKEKKRVSTHNDSVSVGDLLKMFQIFG